MSARRILLAAAAVLLPLLGAAPVWAQSPAADLPEAIRKQGFIRVGIEATYPPMAYKDPATNERRGINVDLLNALGKVMGVEIRYEEMAFAQLIPAVTTERVDFSGTAMSDTAARRETLSFVDYLSTGAQIFTTTAQARGAKEAVDFCGRSVATPRTTNYPRQVQEWSDAHCVAAGKPPIRVIGTDGAAASRLDLQQGRADGAVLGAEYVVYLQSLEPGNFVTVGAPITRGLFGLAFAKKDAALRDAVAAGLQRMVADGSYAEIVRRNGMERQALTAITVDQGE
ncbi:ABC transporter substrate-binding protein [Roseomonas elaeocarpi]|uniref:ABC transporter substrate-binding protein n=1 Tax=Roseomonas elaeocarpi TaxID=907779 RepID=A0ABV6JN76_9PROT